MLRICKSEIIVTFTVHKMYVVATLPASNCCRVSVTEDGKKALITLANGDMRKVLNVLQVRSNTPFQHTLPLSQHNILHTLIPCRSVVQCYNRVPTYKTALFQNMPLYATTYIARIKMKNSHFLSMFYKFAKST